MTALQVELRLLERLQQYKRIKEEEKTSRMCRAPGRIHTHDLLVMKHVLHCCAANAALVKLGALKNR